MKLSLATWNINSIRSRVHLIEQFVAGFEPDILCLQEIKCTNEQFPLEAIRRLGFTHIELNGQKAYHGVATLSRVPIKRLECRDYNGSGDSRHLSVQVGEDENRPPLVLHNFYVPAGGDIPDAVANPKFGQKLDYLGAMAKWFGAKRKKAENRFVLVGDLNVAPLESDVWSHKQLLKVVSHTPEEVDHVEALRRAHNWVDVMRHHIPEPEKLFTWWSYRARDWRLSNRGRRLDHVWVTPALASASREMSVVDEARDWEKPSDHAPVLVQLDLAAR